jgi:hypothetical protein
MSPSPLKYLEVKYLAMLQFCEQVCSCCQIELARMYACMNTALIPWVIGTASLGDWETGARQAVVQLALPGCSLTCAAAAAVVLLLR